ncbi:TetR/AcrR family transcriptional regulator [Microbacterium sp. H83]|uniref:TetR/AcrR family transcriptional regulator n=1 Tax=Microbacterium sp. H83 TaxID=1827324 RepID=UPI0009ED2E50|nr:TetR family transcriptional regulator [Microbacterium sp. H83]
MSREVGDAGETGAADETGAGARPVGSRSGRRTDPERRDRIIAACLDVIAESGVAGASHRRIAEAAGVPLGSMTYHFDGIDDLLHEAFTRFSTMISARFEHRLAAASDLESARAAVVDIIREDVFGDTREFVLSHELYTLAARKPEYRALTTAWMQRSRAALERHFDPDTARLLDAMIEGISIHRALDEQAREVGEIAVAVERITTP